MIVWHISSLEVRVGKGKKEVFEINKHLGRIHTPRRRKPLLKCWGGREGGRHAGGEV